MSKTITSRHTDKMTGKVTEKYSDGTTKTYTQNMGSASVEFTDVSLGSGLAENAKKKIIGHNKKRDDAIKNAGG